jgi:hypothetical protein
MNLAGWLRSLGLEQYEETFRQNAVDETVLPSLTAEDLKDLVVCELVQAPKRRCPTLLLQPTGPPMMPPSAVT